MLAHVSAVEPTLDPAALAATLAPGSPSATLHAPVRRDAVLDAAGGITLHETLGEGGMGVVRRGTQSVLAREVAVKSLREAAGDPTAMTKIVREALVMGRLEHPNIVPIYTIDADPRGRPRIVMKRVQGEAWSTMIRDPEAVRARSGGDPLHWHLRVFVQVCHALAYAHSRGIVHLDLKPDNVMLGPFGEVLLLDWGIALALDDTVDPRVPRLVDNADIIGTPRYMAPEVLAGVGAAMGVHTDVYLLGATLFEIVTGRPPHRGTTMGEVIASIVHVDPALDVECPSELAAIVQRCLARDPAQRPDSAMAVARAVEDLLEHRASHGLCDDADAQRVALERRLDDDGVDADEDAVYQAFGAVRFGYANALARWADNTRARGGLEAVTRQIVTWELARGRVDAAAVALGAHGEVAPELRAAIETARAAEAARVARLSALEREHDPRLGQRTRLFMLTLLTGIWVLIPLGAWLHGHDPQTEPVGIVPVAGAIMLAALLGFATWARASLSSTALNRGVVAALAVMLVVQIAQGLLAGPLGLGMAQLQALVLLVYTATAAFVTVLLERRMWPTAVGFAIATLVVAAWPTTRNLVLAVANLGCGINAAWAWRMSLAQLREPRPGAITRPRAAR